MDSPLPHDQYRAGIVAIIGRANVGKSTLINQILGEKVSITSSVAQTTRNAIRGIHSEARGQLVFLDTPGVHKAQHDLGKLMNKTARASVEGVDVALLVLDASSNPREEDEGWMRRLAKSDLSMVFALNKQDQPGNLQDHRYRELWQQIADEKSCQASPAWLPLSAATGSGIAPLLDTLFARIPIGPPLFDEDLLTDFPRKLAIADVVREKLFEHLHEELPHAIAVNVTLLEETETTWNIEADILVNRPSQKGIVIGNKGRQLKKVTADAEKELGDMFEVSVTLRLWVKVEKDWARNFWILKQLGHVP